MSILSRPLSLRPLRAIPNPRASGRVHRRPRPRRAWPAGATSPGGARAACCRRPTTRTPAALAPGEWEAQQGRHRGLWRRADSGRRGEGLCRPPPGHTGAQGGGIHKAYPGMVCGQNPHGEMARIAASSALRSWSTRPRRVRACTLSPRRLPDVPRWPTGPQPAPFVVSNATVCDPTCRRIQACRTSITPGRSSQRG